MRCMPSNIHAPSVSLSVTWAPRRFPLGWADRAGDVPPWDMSRGVASTPLWADECYEDFLDLPPKRREGKQEEIEKAFHPDDPPTHGYPRLVRAWPGYSRRVLPVPDVVAVGPDVLQEWPPRKPAYKGMLELWGELGDEEGLRAGVLAFAEAYSLLNPAGGDTLDDWIIAVVRFRMLHRVAERLREMYGLSDSGDWVQAAGEEALKAVTDARRKLPPRLLALSPFRHPVGKFYVGGKSVYDSEPLYFEKLGVYGLQGALRAEHSGGEHPLHRLAAFLLDDIGQVRLNPVPWGLKLEAGVWAWVAFEYVHVLGRTRMRRCVICNEPLSPDARADAITCSHTCREGKSRRVRRARDLIEQGIGLRAAAEQVSLNWRVLKAALSPKK